MKKDQAKSCKTCQWLDVAEDEIGRRVVFKNKAYLCAWPAPNIDFPSSVTTWYGFRWPPSRNYMRGQDGTTCKTWQKVIKKSKTA